MYQANKSKQVVYSLIAFVYVLLIAFYGTAPLSSLLSGLPHAVGVLIYYIVVMLPLVILTGLAMRLSSRDRENR